MMTLFFFRRDTMIGVLIIMFHVPCRIQVARLVPVVSTFRTCVQANSGRNMAIKDRF